MNNDATKDIDLELLANKIDIIYRSLPLISKQLEKIESDLKGLKRKKHTPNYTPKYTPKYTPPPIDWFKPYDSKDDDWWRNLEVKYGSPTCDNTSKDVKENVGVITSTTGDPFTTIFDEFFGKAK